MKAAKEPSGMLPAGHPAARLEAVLDRMTEGLVVATTDGQVVYWNRAGLAMHDVASLDEARSTLSGFTDTFQLSTLEGVVLPVEEWPLGRVLRGEDVDHVELLARRLDRDWERQLIYSGSTFETVDGRVVAFITITDVTERRAVEHELVRGAVEARLAIEAAGIGIYEADLVAQTITYSPEAAALVDFPANVPIPAASALARVHPGDVPAVAAVADELVRLPIGQAGRGEGRWLTADGDVRVLAWAALSLPSTSPADDRRIGALIDMTSARRTERRLAAQLAVTAQLVEPGASPELMRNVLQAVCDAEDFDIGSYWQVDDAAGVLRCTDVWHRDDPGLAQLADFSRGLEYAPGVGTAGTVWATGRPLALDDVHDGAEHPRGALATAIGLRSAVAFPIEANGQVVGVVDFLGRTPSGTDQLMLDAFAAIGRQIGLSIERRRLELDLLQAQRIEALGVLSRGIAHDFNNILTAIAGNVELALRDTMLSPATRQRLESVSAAQEHARDLVEQVLAFAQQQPSRRSSVSLVATAGDCVRLLETMVPASVAIRLVTEEPVPSVLADATQLQQVIVNLGANAWQALPLGTGSIEVHVAGVDITGIGDDHPGRPPGRYAVISVIDDGAGMDVATLRRIFDPFFTTKHPGEGTGLGLSVVHGIVVAHQGFVDVSSVVGEGTRFDIYLPGITGSDALPTAPVGNAAQTVDAAGDQVDSARLRKHVLFLDDEHMLAELAVQMFPELGYRATVRTDPEEALAWLADHVDEVDLVVTDMSMPKHSGLEVAAAVRALRPDLPVLLLSGYVAADVAEEARRLGVREIVSKPVSLRGLADALQRALS